MNTSITFADSRRTYGNERYVLAQFRADSWLDWVPELRAFLIKDELKYKHFSTERHRVEANRELWRRVQRGVKQAEIIVLERQLYLDVALQRFTDAGAEFGVDFTERDIWQEGGRAALDHSPLSWVASTSRYDFLSDNTIGQRYRRFDSAELFEKAGGKFNDAIVLAARSHASLGTSEVLAAREGETPWYSMTPLPLMEHTFDQEHLRSVAILNDASVALEHSLGRPLIGFGSAAQPFREENSRRIDHLQAADMAAGWAADMLDEGRPYRELANFFSAVKVNGIWVPDL